MAALEAAKHTEYGHGSGGAVKSSSFVEEDGVYRTSLSTKGDNFISMNPLHIKKNSGKTDIDGNGESSMVEFGDIEREHGDQIPKQTSYSGLNCWTEDPLPPWKKMGKGGKRKKLGDASQKI